MSEELLQHAVLAARAGARVLVRTFGASDLAVERKATNDFVSRADRESEAAVVEVIRRHHPEHRILAEERGSGGGSGDYEWVIDPLDGTTNFLQGLPMFCVSVACRRGDELLAGVVLDPVRDDLFTAARGAGAWRNGQPMRVSDRPGLDGAFLATGFPFRAHQALERYLGAFRDVFLKARAIRRCGAAALDLAYTAAGIYDGFFEFRLSAWDVAAGGLLVREAGGRVTDLEGGDRFTESGDVVAGNPGVQPELLELVRRHTDTAALDRLVPESPQPAGVAG
jgi:myo-inositol-1(or 4)-monophosphatase